LSNNQITADLYEIFDDFFEVAEEDFGPELTADQVDGWDSLNHIRLMLAVGQKFGVKFTTGELSNLKNVGDLMALLERKV
jgi:acyl carrier protein